MDDGWSIENFGNAYRNWLMERMRAQDYGILFDYLYDTEFTWKKDIPRDADRASDGRLLRLRFGEEANLDIPDGCLEHPCSFLEFLVGLAYEIDDLIMYDADNPDQAADWFWMMSSNIGLTPYRDVKMVIDGKYAYECVNEIISRVIERTYDYNGDKGLFPLRHPEMDQRKVEIWYQANAYMIENFFA